MTIPNELGLITKSIQAMVGLPRLVDMTLVDEIQDNSSQLEAKLNRPGLSVRSVAYQQQVGSVRQRTRIYSNQSHAQVDKIAVQIMQDSESVAQRIASTLRMYMGLKVAVK